MERDKRIGTLTYCRVLSPTPGASSQSGPCSTRPIMTLLLDPREELPFTKSDRGCLSLTHHSPQGILKLMDPISTAHHIGPPTTPSQDPKLSSEPQTPSMATNSSPHFSGTHLSPPLHRQPEIITQISSFLAGAGGEPKSAE